MSFFFNSNASKFKPKSKDSFLFLNKLTSYQLVVCRNCVLVVYLSFLNNMTDNLDSTNNEKNKGAGGQPSGKITNDL